MAHLGRLILFVKNPERMAQFYDNALGLTTVLDTPGWHVLADARGAELALHGIPDEVARDIHIDSPPTPRANTPLKPVFFVADLGVAAQAVVAAGGRTSAPVDLPDYSYRDLIDPEGNVVQICAPHKEV